MKCPRRLSLHNQESTVHRKSIVQSILRHVKSDYSVFTVHIPGADPGGAHPVRAPPPPPIKLEKYDFFA